MACLTKEIWIDAAPEKVWEAVSDVGSVHTRLARGFVLDTRLEGTHRWVTFYNGLVVREIIVAINDERRRLSYSAASGRLSHHNAFIEVFAEDQHRSRIIWTTDFLPDEMTATIADMIEKGAEAMKRTLESAESISAQIGSRTAGLPID